MSCISRSAQFSLAEPPAAALPQQAYFGGANAAPVRVQEPWGAAWVCRSAGEDDPEFARGAVPAAAIAADGARELAAEARAWWQSTQGVSKPGELVRTQRAAKLKSESRKSS